MTVIIYLSGHLKSYTGGETEVSLDSDFTAVFDVLDMLWKRHPALRDRILTEQGDVRQHVNIFDGDRDVKRSGGLQTPVNSSEIHIFNAVSGG